MPTYHIRGQVINQANQQIIQKAEVKLTVHINNQLIEEETAAVVSGTFKMSFSNEFIPDGTEATFEVHDDKGNLLPTDFRLGLFITADEFQVRIPVEVPGDQPDEPGYFVLNGRVTDRLGRNLIGAKVEMVPLKESGDPVPINTVTTDKKGAFIFSFSKEDTFTIFYKECSGFYFKVSYNDRLVMDTKNTLVWDISQDPSINIQTGTVAEPGVKLLPKTQVLDIKAFAHFTWSELADRQPEAVSYIQGIALENLKEDIIAKLEDSPEEIRAIVANTDMRGCVAKKFPFKDFILKMADFNGASPEQLETLRTKFDAIEMAPTLNHLLSDSTALKNLPVFQQEFKQAAIYQISDLSDLSDDKAELLILRDLSPVEINPENLAVLVKEKLLQLSEAQHLALNTNIYLFAGQNDQLTGVLKKINNSGTLKDLAMRKLSRANWQKHLEDANYHPSNGLDREKQAGLLYKQLEYLYPHEALKAQHKAIAQKDAVNNLEIITPLFKENDQLFNGVPYAGLRSADVSDADQKALQDAYESLQKQINRYAGLELSSLFDNRKLSETKKAQEASRRVGLLEKFYEQNEDLAFLTLDYTSQSNDVEKLNLTGFSTADRRYITQSLKIDQSLYRLTKDAEDTYKLKEAGYFAAHQPALDSFSNFVNKTGLKKEPALYYFELSQKGLITLLSNVGSIAELTTDPLFNSPVNNTHQEVQSFLRELNGYTDFFGTFSSCQCKHCQSIISPVAYFADLMAFLKENILDRYFDGGDSDHILNPKIRRADLWNSLPLDCNATETLIPYLVIINEVLENFIATQSGFSKNHLSDRNAVEQFVYAKIIEEPFSSFRQPFHLPLAEIDIYLKHFSIARYDVLQKILLHTGENSPVVTQAALKLSETEYNIIARVPIEDNAEDLEDLTNELGILFKRTIPSSDTAVPLQHFLHVMAIKRIEFEDLVKTWFVTGGMNIEILPPARLEGGEHVRGLTYEILDRMHRFARLWRRLEWSVAELDLMLYTLHSGEHTSDLLLHEIVQIIDLQKTLHVNVPELSALIYSITGDINLFNSRFNLPGFIKAGTDHPESDFWVPASLDLPFKHPAYQTDVSTEEAHTTLLHRLLSGLGINDEELYLLVENLHQVLHVKRTGRDRGTFKITDTTLSILYKHAKILKLLGLKVSELFFLITLSPAISGSFLQSWTDIKALLEVTMWYRNSGYTLNELALVLKLSLPKNEELVVEDPNVIAEEIRARVDVEQRLVFPDTLFSFFKGITEEQSRQIIDANEEWITVANLRTYRVKEEVDALSFNLDLTESVLPGSSKAERLLVTGFLLQLISYQLRNTNPVISVAEPDTTSGLTTTQLEAILLANNSLFLRDDTTGNFSVSPAIINNPNTIGLSIQETLWTSLTAGKKSELLSEMLLRVSRYMQQGAPQFSDRIFVDIVDLSVERSRELLGVNMDIFEELKQPNRYWLTAEFDPNIPIHIPVNVPLLPSDAQNLLLRSHASELVSNHIGAWLNIPVEKVKALALLAEYSFSSHETAAHLTEILQGAAPQDELVSLITTMQRLSVWFKNSLFDADTLDFIYRNAGGNETIFHISIPSGFRTPTLQQVQQTNQYARLQKEAAEVVNDFRGALIDYDTGNAKFTAEGIQHLEAVLKTDSSMLSTLNSVLDFPVANATGGASNRVLDAYSKIKDNNELVKYLGIGAEVLHLFDSNDFDELSRVSESVITAIRTKYHNEDEWQEKIEPFEDELRERKRDALTDYLIQSFRIQNQQWFKTTYDLYNYFLIDTEMSGCGRTSRVVAGISSLQLYVQRCQMNLEQSEDGQIHVLPENLPAGQWEWRKNYRVWEANRKVFLYPENYLEPDLRDDKTPLFQELESELLQQEINPQNVLDAYGKYMKGFEDIARLKIAGAYHDRNGEADVLHLFGVTSSKPPQYYYRTIENVYKAEQHPGEYGIVYRPWVKINVQIPVDQVSPIVYNGKLYVFWVEISTRPENKMVQGSNRFIGYKHTLQVKCTSLRIDGSWNAPQKIKLPDLFDKGDGVIWDPLEVQFEDAEPIDGYTLLSYRWDRVFPEIDSTNTLILRHALPESNFLFDTGIDLYNLNSGLAKTTIPATLERLSPESKRLTVLDGNISYSLPDANTGSGYGDAIKILFQGSLTTPIPLITFNAVPGPALVNGALTDALLDVEGDLLYIHSTGYINHLSYAIKRLGTTLSEKMVRKLFESGISALLDINFQESDLIENRLPLAGSESESLNDDEVINDTIKNVGFLDTKGSLGIYFREIFFHIPFLIANHLNSQGKFADAQHWYHYIFDPTSNNLPPDLGSITDPEQRRKREADRVWQFIEFRNHDLASLWTQLNDPQAISAYEENPFNPHAIARTRLGAYMKCVVMKYIDNLLDWGDDLFARDTTESINEATLLYVLAAQILGPRPPETGICSREEETPPVYNTLEWKMNGQECTQFLSEAASITTQSRRPYDAAVTSNAGKINSVKNNSIFMAFLEAGTHPTVSSEGVISGGRAFALSEDRVIGHKDESEQFNPSWNRKPARVTITLPFFGNSFLKQACLFCIPPNQDLLAYWDRVDDRLYKIRNCMNLSGIRRQLALFAPEIDPHLLVRARAAGLSLEDVLNSVNADIPPYRFSFLIGKAKEYAGAVQSYGTALMGALVNKDAERLSDLRLVQQDNILKLTTRMRDMEVEAAEVSLTSVTDRRNTILNRKNYYQTLLTNGLSGWEVTQQVSKHIANGLMPGVIALALIRGGTSLIPRILGTANSTGGEEATDSLRSFGDAMRTLSSYSAQLADSMALEASFHRRKESWRFSLEQSELELVEIERQIEAAEIRRDISIESRKLHEKTIEQQQETFEFYRDKFSNLGLYTWLSTELQRMFRATFQSAMSIARMAERAYRFERNDDTIVFLQGNYWDSEHAGLLSGEKLMNELRHMELRYMETNSRSMEIDQAFSLTQIDPAALIRLKAEGDCDFTVPELYFDLFYPGQFKRQIKSARLTIPCITGPYSNVSAVLTLKGSKIRKEANTDEGLIDVPPSRSVTIATSTAQNDAGVFKLDFQNERYMPFEGAGAVESTWQLQLPKNFRPFDYSTINDVILHISYTADYDDSFRTTMEEGMGRLNQILTNDGFSLPRVFSLRQEFSQVFHRLLHSPVDQIIRLELDEKHFPLFLQGQTLEVTAAKLILEVDSDGFRSAEGTIDLPGEYPVFAITGNSNGTASVDEFELDDTVGMFAAEISTAVLQPFIPACTPLALTLRVSGANDFAPVNALPSDPSALDDHKLKDVYLLLEYRIVST